MGIEKHSESKRKGITVALKVVLAFRNSGLNNNSSPQTSISSSFMCVFVFVNILNPC